MTERFCLYCTGPKGKVAGSRGGGVYKRDIHFFWNCTFPVMISWELSFVSFSKTSKTVLVPALSEYRQGLCCKNAFVVSDFRFWPKLQQIETTFPLLYRALLICMIDSCESKTWIIGFSELFPIFKSYLTDANLGGYLSSHFQLNGIKVRAFFEKKVPKKKHLCYHDRNYCYFWQSKIPVINLIVGSRNMV